MGLEFVKLNALIGLLVLARLSLGSSVVPEAATDVVSSNELDAMLVAQDQEPAQISFFDSGLNSDYEFKNHWNVPGFDLDLDALRLVRFSLDKDEEPAWMTEREKLHAKKAGVGFIDVTEHPTFGLDIYPSFQAKQEVSVSYPTPNSSFVPKIFSLLSSEEQRSNLEIFTSFYTRYYNSDTGHASSRWLFNRALNYTDMYASAALRAAVNIEVVLVEHKFKQESVIVRLTPRNPSPSLTSNEDGIIILGAHCDSLNHENPFFRAPGADDDGSGTVTVLEAMRGILASGYIPVSPLEFHFYAGEEGGLLGSLDIAIAYAKANKMIKGMMQLDMTAWRKSNTEKIIAVATDHVDPALTEYLKVLVDAYLDIPWKETAYRGTAGSDHMSWTGVGYKSCHALEGEFWDGMNIANAHSANDTIDISEEFSFEHIMRFTKLATAFAVELSSY